MTLLKYIPFIVVLMMSIISAAQANNGFSHGVLTLLDDPKNEEPWVLVITTQKEWENFYSKPLAYMTFLEGQVPAVPEIDFERYQILTGGIGVNNTGGYQVVVKNVQELEDELLVHLLMIRPGSKCITLQALTYPSATIFVEKSEKPFSFKVSQLVDECL